MESNSYLYDMNNKREVKANSRSETYASDATYAAPKPSRWQTPITRNEINVFYSQYQDFIDAGKRYQQNVLSYRPPEEPERPKR